MYRNLVLPRSNNCKLPRNSSMVLSISGVPVAAWIATRMLAEPRQAMRGGAQNRTDPTKRFESSRSQISGKASGRRISHPAQGRHRAAMAWRVQDWRKPPSCPLPKRRREHGQRCCGEAGAAPFGITTTTRSDGWAPRRRGNPACRSTRSSCERSNAWHAECLSAARTVA